MYKISIMIPALNEGRNISYVLESLLKQKQRNFKISEIIVVSDCSTDDTVEKARSVNSKLIKVVDGKTRKGKSSRINWFFKNVKNNIGIVCDADIKIVDHNYVLKLISPIMKGYDLSSSDMGSVKTITRVEEILSVNMDLKKSVFNKYKSGANIYTCKGVARAFSKKLMKSIKFPQISGEDAYSYLYCVKNGFKYKFVSSAIVYIRIPGTIKDHLKQSLRFGESREIMSGYFGKDFVQNQYKLPLNILIPEFLKSFVRKPYENIMYFLLNLYSRISSLSYKSESAIWEIAVSSKVLN